MIETLTRNNLPDEIAGTYETNGTWNGIVNRFVADGPDATRWVAENEFNFSGFMQIAAFFMQPLFKRTVVEIHARVQGLRGGQIRWGRRRRRTPTSRPR